MRISISISIYIFIYIYENMHGDHTLNLHLLKALGSEKSNDEEISLGQEECSVRSRYEKQRKLNKMETSGHTS